MNSFRGRFLIVCLIFAFNTKGSRIEFTASPDVIKANLSTAASMRCALIDTQVTRAVTNTSTDIAHVTSILITKHEGQIDVAHGSPFEAPAPLTDLGNLQVKGDISGTSSTGYLQLSWINPALVEAGEYSCEIQTLDVHHHHTVFKSSLLLAREAPSVNDVVIMVQTQNQQIKDLTAEVNHLKQQDAAKAQEIVDLNKQISNLNQQDSNKTQEILNLKHILNNQSTDIQSLQTCAAAEVAFMATLNSTGETTVSGDHTVVYGKVLTNTGGAYDPQTGTFTAAIPGLYAFTVSSLIESHGRYNNLNIKVNSNVTSSLAITTEGTGDLRKAAFTRSVVTLKKGDIVFVETEGSYSSTHYLHQYSSHRINTNVFSGVLLHPESCK